VILPLPEGELEGVGAKARKPNPNRLAFKRIMNYGSFFIIPNLIRNREVEMF
jgi:hypothetical protein